jgi:hypothetical protein
MTRINVVPVEELCDQHLFAEFRELTRIPNGLLSFKLKPYYTDKPMDYTLGAGHVKFFTDKLSFLFQRYNQLYAELIFREYDVTYIWPDAIGGYLPAWNGYTPTKEALKINRQRIQERLPVKARWTNRKIAA